MALHISLNVDLRTIFVLNSKGNLENKSLV